MVLVRGTHSPEPHGNHTRILITQHVMRRRMTAPHDSSDIDKNINAIWNDDLLNRRPDADLLQKFLLSRIEERAARGERKSYVLNIDADWGQGKTFFLKRFARQLRQYGYVVAEVDAWKDDHAEDPLLPVIAAIDTTISPFIADKEDVNNRWKKVVRVGSGIALSVAKEAGMYWLRKGIGAGADEVKALFGSNGLAESAQAGAKVIEGAVDKQLGSMIESFNRSNLLIETFKNSFSEFVNDKSMFTKNLPIFVFVDEIDRCRPSFAIKLLERIKHLFDSDGCVFVTSANIDQLKHSICAVYGAGFDSQRYLYRFFDRSYKFLEPELSPFVASVVQSYAIPVERFHLPPRMKFEEYVTSGLSFYGLTLRDAKQCIDIIRSFATVWDHELPIDLSILLPLAIAWQQGVQTSNFFTVNRELKAIREARGNKSIKWEIRFDGQETISGEQLFDKKANFLSKTIYDIINSVNHDHSSSYNWIRSYVIDEWNYLSRAGVKNMSRSSILVSYWSMLRSVGRLS